MIGALTVGHAVRRRRLFPIAVHPEQLAEMLSLSVRSVNRAVKNGELICYAQANGKRLVLVEDAVSWLKMTMRRVS